MKKIFLVISAFALLLTANSCNDLDVEVESQYVKDNFPVTESDYSALLGTMYSNLSSSFAVPYWRMQELSTDESILPARDGNFDDGGQYRQLHYHTWTFDHPNVRGVWEWGFGGINNCNRLLNLVKESPASEASINSSLAEIRAMRALYYFFMMDLYGNVPIIDAFPVVTLPSNQPRAKVFEFIETELRAVVQQLPLKSDANAALYYGRPTKGLAFALLAKMYLNANIYTGGATRYPETVAMTDSILKNTNYSLDPRYADIFAPNNGPQIKETIFAIPYDQQIPGNQFTRFGFLAYLAQAYGFNVGLSIAMSTTPEFYNRFNLANDFRKTTWLVGPQFIPDANGQPTAQPAFFPGTTNQIVITPDLTLKPPKPMDLGNAVTDQLKGIRSIKYF
ncbi:MAG: RagB/SusD family nutrient uptake outer membrane protein, partial [Verrucomicrobia bacterium]|nr:RagB/SusD family nutrient uptake outer membrane protein [Cytophagales bacterium]